MSNNLNNRKDLELFVNNINIARATYEQVEEQNVKLALQYLQNVIADPISGIIAIRWHQLGPMMGPGTGIGDICFQFDPQMFPPNEEYANPLFIWVPAVTVKEYVERGMDVINLCDLVKVEQAIEEVFAALNALNHMTLGLSRLLGKRASVIVFRDRVEVSNQ